MIQFLIQMLMILIGIFFAAYFTIKYLSSLKEKGWRWRRLWQWLKDVATSLTGMG